MDRPIVLIRGAGDLASGVALRLHRAGFRPVMTEISRPLAVRRTVSFSEAVFEGAVQVEGVTGRLSVGGDAVREALGAGEIPVLVDPDLEMLQAGLLPGPLEALVDGRLLKTPVPPAPVEFVIGLGPGFTPGVNCTAVVETMRGHTLGRVYWDRPALENTGLPDGNPARVLRAPQTGLLQPHVEIAQPIRSGETAAHVEGAGGDLPVRAQVSGVVRGMLRPGMRVREGVKIGDIDERADPSYCFLVSDKSLAIGGGVLEALLTRR